MSFTSVAAILAFIGCTAAFPQFGQPNLARQIDDHPWIAPGPGDVRSPCPGTNTLANHGYINRSGRGVTKQAYLDAWLAAFGLDQSGVIDGSNNAINLCSQITGTTCQSFDLDMLNTPHQIEHDASLTRLDRQMAWNTQSDNSHFNATVWEETMESFCDATHIDYSLANTARLNRIAQAKRDDAPGWFIENDGGSLAEHAFTFGPMADESNPAADGSPQYRLDWVDYWFRNERLPTALGWAKPTAPIMASYLNSIAGRVNSAPTASVCSRSSSSAGPTTTAAGPTTTAAGPTTTTAVGPATTESCTESTTKIYPTMNPHYANSSTPVFKTTKTESATTTLGYPTSVVTTSLSAYTITKTLTSYTTVPHSKSETTSAVYIPNTIVAYSTVVVPATTKTAQPFNSAEASKTSSAEALATHIAGPAPSPLNAYYETHSSEEWKDNQGATDSYCSHVGAIAQGILGTWGNTGSFGGSGSNPASYGGMGSSGSGSSNSGSVLCFCPA